MPGGWSKPDDVALIERKFFGGTCVNTGCIPTKTLVASAHAARVARRAGDYGPTIGGPVRVDMKTVKARKDAVVGGSSAGLEGWMKGLANCTVFNDHAQFVSPNESGSKTNCCRQAGLHQCRRPRARTDMPGLDDVRYLQRIHDGPRCPAAASRHLGGSYVGLEFAQMYRRFGSEVTVSRRDRG